MAPRKPDRHELLSVLADHVLTHGLSTASLRPMAKTAGTSDRMLIYHFGSKDALIGELLAHLASRMAAGLDLALPSERFDPEQELVTRILTIMRADEFRPYGRVWLEIVAGAARGIPAYRDAGHGIILVFLDWLAPRHPEGRDGAARTLTLIEGSLVMEAVGHASIADRACHLTAGRS